MINGEHDASGDSERQWGEKRKERRFYRSVPALDPRDSEPWDLLLPESYLSRFNGRSWAAYTLAYLVPEVLLHPTAIFMGVREDPTLDDNMWLCYVGKPSSYYTQPGRPDEGKPVETRPMPQNQVFLVFVTADRVIYTWRREECDHKHKDLPKGYKERYGKQIYPKNKDG